MADDTTTAEEVAAAARRIVSAGYWITTGGSAGIPREVWEQHKRWSGDPQDAILVAQAYLDSVRKISG